MSRTNCVIDDLSRMVKEPSFSNVHNALTKHSDHKYSFQGGTPVESRRRLLREVLSTQNVIPNAQNFDRDLPRRPKNALTSLKNLQKNRSIESTKLQFKKNSQGSKKILNNSDANNRNNDEKRSNLKHILSRIKSSDKGNYFNQKYYDSRQEQIHNKISEAVRAYSVGKLREQSHGQEFGDPKPERVAKHSSIGSVKNLPVLTHNGSINGSPIAKKCDLPRDSIFNKAKMKGYVFMRTPNKDESDEIDRSAHCQGNQETNMDSSSANENVDKVNEENNKLIERILYDKKRQYSCSVEMNNVFKSKFKLLKKKPHRRVLKKFISGDSKKSVVSNPIKSANHSPGSSTRSTGTPLPNNETGDANFNNKGELTNGRNIYHNKVLSVNTISDLPSLSQKTNSAPLSASIFKRQHEKQIEAASQKENSLVRPTDESSNNKSNLRAASSSPDCTLNSKRMTAEQMIAQSMAELARINEENSVSDRSSVCFEDPSPKVSIHIRDTWERDTSKLDETCQEIVNDFEQLELKYKLRENWQDTKAPVEKPFTSDVSVILTPAKRGSK